MRRISALNSILGLTWLLSAALVGPATAATQGLTILHDNDLHGHLRSFCYIEAVRGPREHCNVGGAARRATLIRRLRARATGPLMVVDAGDTTTRGALATTYEGIDEIEAMNAIGYDMAAVGNNEFKLEDGADAQDAAGAQEALERLVRRSRFPWLCANVTDAKGALLPGVEPFIVRQVGLVRVAFLGLTAPRSRLYPQTKGLIITDPIEAAKVWIPRARAEADVVVAVTHLGVIDDQLLVEQTRGIDAVIGGDSHTFLYEPLRVKNLDGMIVPIVQDGAFGVRLGEFRLVFRGDAASGWRLDHFTDRLISIDESMTPDRQISDLVEGYAHPLDVDIGTAGKIGSTPAERRQLTAETLAHAWKSSAGTDVGLQREDDIYDAISAHDVSLFALQAVLPFHETVWRGQMSGATLKQLLGKPTTYGGAVRSTISQANVVETKTYSVAMTTFFAQSILPGGEDTKEDSRLAAEHWLGGMAGQMLR